MSTTTTLSITFQALERKKHFHDICGSTASGCQPIITAVCLLDVLLCRLPGQAAEIFSLFISAQVSSFNTLKDSACRSKTLESLVVLKGGGGGRGGEGRGGLGRTKGST